LKIDTTRFGTIRIKKEDIIHMPDGMLGFPDKKQYLILQHKENSPFFWYQSLDDPGLAFVITNPFLFIPDYKIDLKAVLKEMSWDTNGKNNFLELHIVVNIPKGKPHQMTGNFIGPILINNDLNQSVQLVLPNSPYTHKFPLLKKN
jgi:flagellar assembly factor FliW